MHHDTEHGEIGDFQLGPFLVLPSQSLIRTYAPSEAASDSTPAHTSNPNSEPETESGRKAVDIHLEPKVMAVLERLAKTPQQVVSRHTLLDDVWTGTVVTEEVVTRCISELRTALGDNSRAPRFIQTIPKKGYKLLQVPVPQARQQTATGNASAAAPAGTDFEVAGSPGTANHSGNSSTGANALPVAQGIATDGTAGGLAGLSAADTGKRPRLYWALMASIAVATAALGFAGVLYLQERETPPEGATVAAQLSPAETIPSIAILPFATLDSGAESNYFGAGLAEELLNALANVPGLRVISRHAAADARDTGNPASKDNGRSATAGSDISAIGQTLGVDHVLTGSVRRMNNDVRVTAQLVKATDGELLWADQFEGDLSDVFRIQDDIAAAIVGALRLQLTEPVRVARISDDMDALDYYLLGRHHWHQRTSESLRRAIELFKRAVQVDSDMAIGYSGLADAYLLLADYGNMTPEEAEALARPAIETALRLDNNLAEAHASQGMLYLQNGETELAERALRNAVRLNPGYHMAHMWLGSTVAKRGQVLDAHKFYLKAYRLDPLHPVINQNVAMSFATIGDYESSKAILQKLDQRFDNRNRLTFMKLHLAQQLGNFDELRELADTAIAGADIKLKLAGFQALWMMHNRLGQHEAAANYLRRAQAESEDSEIGYEFRLVVARKLAREGAAKEFNEFMQAAPEYFHKKAKLEKRTLEGMLLIATENYGTAAKVLETALAASESTRHPASELLSISHLLFVYNQLGNSQRKDYWLARGKNVIANALAAGYGQIEFITEMGFYHAAAGQAEEASKAFWQALSLGKLAPWEITDDVRIGPIQRSDRLQPVIQQAASAWTA